MGSSPASSPRRSVSSSATMACGTATGRRRASRPEWPDRERKLVASDGQRRASRSRARGAGQTGCAPGSSSAWTGRRTVSPTRTSARRCEPFRRTSVELRLPVLDLERELRQPLRDRPVELSLVPLVDSLLERAREVVADVGEQLRARLDGVDVVAVQLLSLVAVGSVVRLETVPRLLDDVRVVAYEQVELPLDHVGETRTPEDHPCSTASRAGGSAPREPPSRSRFPSSS